MNEANVTETMFSIEPVQRPAEVKQLYFTFVFILNTIIKGN
jgi:hypothetical protein